MPVASRSDSWDEGERDVARQRKSQAGDAFHGRPTTRERDGMADATEGGLFQYIVIEMFGLFQYSGVIYRDVQISEIAFCIFFKSRPISVQFQLIEKSLVNWYLNWLILPYHKQYTCMLQGFGRPKPNNYG